MHVTVAMATRASQVLLLALAALLVGVVPLGYAQTPSFPFDLASCMPLTLSNLADPNQLGNFGNLHDSLSMRIDNEFFSPQVRALNFHTVCEVAGLTRGTVSAVSFVAEYECLGEPCTRTGENSTITTEQFQYNCSARIMEGITIIFYNSFFNDRVRTVNRTADFSTVPEKRCGLCVNPGPGVPSDPDTHCIRKHICKYLQSDQLFCPL